MALNDFAKKQTKRSKKRGATQGNGFESRGGVRSWLWISSGLSLALFIGGLTYLQHSRPSGKDAPIEHAAAEKPKARPQQPAPERPKFEFYDMLSEQKVDVRSDPIEQPSEKAQTPQPVYLKVETFERFEEANAKKAELALLGFRSQIYSIAHNEGTRYTLALGPYPTVASAKLRQRSLAANAIDTTLTQDFH